MSRLLALPAALLAVLSGATGAASATPLASPAATPSPSTPSIQSSDYPRPFLGIGDQGLRIDGRGRAHAAYVGDAVYYAREADRGWQVEVVTDPPAPIYNGTYQPLPALALDAGGAPHLAFLDPSHRSVLHARRTADGWAIETVATAAPGAIMTFETAIALDRDGAPHVVYGEKGVLKYARRAGSAWVSETVDWRGWMEMYFSLQVDDAGTAQVSYFAPSAGKTRMKYARRVGGEWRTETIDRTDFVGEFNSLALDRDGVPQVSYLDVTHEQLKYARRIEAHRWEVAVVDASKWFGGFTSIAVDRAGRPHISYTGVGNQARYASWDGTRWRIRPIADHVWYTALALEPDDTPLVAYYSLSSRELLAARWDGAQWRIRRIDGISR